MTLHGPVVLVTAAALAGCGGDGKDAGEDRVEKLFQQRIAAGLLDEVDAPQSRIDEAARGLDVTCKPTRARDYECIMETSTARDAACTVRANGDQTRIEEVRCSVTGEAPVTTAEYVDCSTVAPVVDAADPEGDPSGSQAALARKQLRSGDLTAVRVAATPDRLCVEWETAAPISIERPQSLDLGIRPVGGQTSQLSLVVAFEKGKAADISASGLGSISGEAGTRGRRTSVVVDADSVPIPAWGSAIAGRFTFEAHARSDDYLDSLPDGPRRPSYPR